MNSKHAECAHNISRVDALDILIFLGKEEWLSTW